MLERPPIKTEVVSVRMSPEELRVVDQRAKDCGKCLSTYMRTVALGGISRARPRRIEPDQVSIEEIAGGKSTLFELQVAANDLGKTTRR